MFANAYRSGAGRLVKHYFNCVNFHAVCFLCTILWSRSFEWTFSGKTKRPVQSPRAAMIYHLPTLGCLVLKVHVCGAAPTSLRLNEALAFLNLTERYGLADWWVLSQLCHFVICQVQRRSGGLRMDQRSRIFRWHSETALIVGALKPSWRCFGGKRILRHFCGRVKLCLKAVIVSISQAVY